MWLENFYTGGQEYIIGYKNGTHYIKKVLPDCYPESETIFVGPYKECLVVKKRLEIRYLDSLL